MVLTLIINENTSAKLKAYTQLGTYQLMNKLFINQQADGNYSNNSIIFHFICQLSNSQPQHWDLDFPSFPIHITKSQLALMKKWFNHIDINLLDLMYNLQANSYHHLHLHCHHRVASKLFLGVKIATCSTLTKVRSCQVPKQARVVTVSFQIVSGNQIFNTFFDYLKVRLQICNISFQNLKVKKQIKKQSIGMKVF